MWCRSSTSARKPRTAMAATASKAFSSEVDTGSREENVSKQKTGARF
jgi:hypothetical protein